MDYSFLTFKEIFITGSIIVAQILAIIVPVFLSVAFLVYAERKVLASRDFWPKPRSEAETNGNLKMVRN